MADTILIKGVCICVIESAYVFLQFLVNLMPYVHMCFYSFGVEYIESAYMFLVMI